MGKNLLLEIGTEEIPAKFMKSTLEQMKEITKSSFEENRIAYGSIRTMGTPRRITLIAEDVNEIQRDFQETVKGPSKKAAYDEDGKPTKALIGFMASQSVDEKDIIIRNIGDIEYVFVNKLLRGRSVKEILPTVLPKIIFSLSFPKSMKWNNYDIRFVRPIRWIVAMLGSNVVDFKVENINSSNITRGHRTLSDKELRISDSKDYERILQENYVIVDDSIRKETIRAQIRDIAGKLGGEVFKDEELLEEITFLVEYPTALEGRIEEGFLKLPVEAVTTPMKEHQRYFPVLKENTLLPYFITVRNGNDEHLDIVRKGNERVLRARLSDAMFFYEEDLKEKLESRVEKLKNIVFQQKLGSVYDKVARIMKLSEHIAEKLGLDENVKQKLNRAAYLCKADIVTNMVGEFDELQGIMGREYAQKDGEAEEVCEAIYTHYMPRFSEDDIPQDEIGRIISIADKIDSVSGSFAMGVQPTGSQDPYGLRRMALGIIRVAVEGTLDIDIQSIIEISLEQFSNLFDFDNEKVKSELLGFFKQRFRVMMSENGHRFEIIDATIENNSNFMNAKKKIELLELELRSDNQFDKLIKAMTRVYNLAGKAKTTDINTKLFENEFEDMLYNKINDLRLDFIRANKDKNYKEAVRILYELIEPINSYFENVMIMSEDERIRNNRLALLNNITSISSELCNFAILV